MEQGETCLRGFFSLFLQVLHEIQYCEKNELDPWISFTNRRYLYGEDFWDDMFFPVGNQPEEDKTLIINIESRNTPKLTWNIHELKKLKRIIDQYIKVKPEIQKRINRSKLQFKGYKVLGMHVRRTDHHMEHRPVRLEQYYHEVDNRVAYYDKLFIASDSEEVVNKLVDRYGESFVIHNNVFRSSDDQAIHKNESIQDRTRIAIEALLDAVALSWCDYLVLSHSNLSYSALCFSPSTPFKVMQYLPYDSSVANIPYRFRQFYRGTISSIKN